MQIDMSITAGELTDLIKGLNSYIIRPIQDLPEETNFVSHEPEVDPVAIWVVGSSTREKYNLMAPFREGDTISVPFGCERLALRVTRVGSFSNNDQSKWFWNVGLEVK